MRPCQFLWFAVKRFTVGRFVCGLWLNRLVDVEGGLFPVYMVIILWFTVCDLWFTDECALPALTKAALGHQDLHESLFYCATHIACFEKHAGTGPRLRVVGGGS